MSPAIRTTGLVRRFGDVTALAGVGLDVEPGEIFGLLGPNGAGKTTLVRILTTLLQPTAGEAFVFGHRTTAEAARVRAMIGVALQEASLDPRQTGRELLTLHARLYGLRGAVLRQQTAAVASFVGLEHVLDRLISTYSGGMRRRLDLAAALVHRPRALFLDEPTTGLDPPSRELVWERVSELRARDGTTVLLTTQYLEEADRLADRVAILNAGQVVRAGKPSDLKAELGSDVIMVRTRPGEADRAVATIRQLSVLDHLEGVDVLPTVSGCKLFVSGGDGAVPTLLEAIDQAGLQPESITVARPTLDDVFLVATGGRVSIGDSQEAGVREVSA